MRDASTAALSGVRAPPCETQRAKSEDASPCRALFSRREQNVDFVKTLILAQCSVLGRLVWVLQRFTLDM